LFVLRLGRLFFQNIGAHPFGSRGAVAVELQIGGAWQRDYSG
jgi:hypothetical protein